MKLFLTFFLAFISTVLFAADPVSVRTTNGTSYFQTLNNSTNIDTFQNNSTGDSFLRLNSSSGSSDVGIIFNNSADAINSYGFQRNNVGSFAFNHSDGIYPAGTVSTRLFFDTSGNVGIGTSTATARLTVLGVSGAEDAAVFNGAANANAGLTINSLFGAGDTSLKLLNSTDSTHSWVLQRLNAGGFGFLYSDGLYPAGTLSYRFFIDTSGNFGIGTTTPASMLDVVQTGTFGNLSVRTNAWVTNNLTAGNVYIPTVGVLGNDGNVNHWIAPLKSSGQRFFSGNVQQFNVWGAANRGWEWNDASAGVNKMALDSDTGNLVIPGFIKATNGFASYSSNLLASAVITVGASPFSWTNTTDKNINVFVDGVSVTGTTSINGDVMYSTIGQNLLPLQKNEWVTITYTIGTPTAKWRPF